MRYTLVRAGGVNDVAAAADDDDDDDDDAGAVRGRAAE